jgi:uncharacterized protein YcaQ
MDNDMGNYVWILVPIVAILSGTVRTWLRVQATQRQLGTSTRELERDLADLAKAKAELAERVQNLETIVVSQTWGVLTDQNLAPAQREAKLAAVAHRELAPVDPSESARQRAEHLARRLQ